jgi:chitinase
MGGCADGETEIVKDTNNHVKKKDQDCAGGLQSFCCKGFKPAPNVGDLGKMAADAAKAAAAAAAEQAALDVAAKAFCRVAVPALLAPLELLEDLIPIVGEILDIAEIAATPALIQLCVKGVEKEGKAEFKVFGKKHTLTVSIKTRCVALQANFVQMKTEKPSETRAPESKHTSAKTSSDSWTSCSSKAQPRADEPRPKRQCRRPEKHVVRTVALEDVQVNPKDVNLNCADNAQPCLHYRSVIKRDKAYAVNTCPYVQNPAGRGSDLQAKKDWEGQHPKNKWRAAVSDGGLIPNRQPGKEKKGCQADEWPPYVLFHEVDGYNRAIDPAFANRPPINKQQYMRYLDGTENGRVGNKWQCKEIAERHSANSRTHSVIGPDGTTTSYTDWTGVYTRTVYRIDPDASDPDGDDGIGRNDCYPRGVNNDNRYQGYALLNNDPWYHGAAPAANYKMDPPSNAKRNWLDLEDIVSIGVNSTRRITEEEYEELQHRLAFAKCSNGDCDGDDVVKVPLPVSTTLASEGMLPTNSIPMPQDSAGDPKLPRQTQSF